MDDTVHRPDRPQPLGDRARAWIEWFGLARLVTAATAVAVVCAGGWWLLRAPVPPPESVLPRATAIVTTTPSVSASAATTTVVVGPSVLRVHVTGAVARAGVYDFVPGERIGDAVATAGGATSAGRPHELNLAARLTDGMRVVVPVEGEEVPAELRRSAVAGHDDEPGDGVGRPIDVNLASATVLDELPGVGPATANAIVDERELHGPFTSVDDLLRVPGIGPAKLARLREAVTT